MRGIKNQPHPIFAPVDKSHGFIDNTGWVFQGETAAGSIAFLIGAGGGPPFSNFPGVGSVLDVLDGNFHHLAGTWDGNTIRLYVDGALQGTASLSTPFNNTRALNIGFAGGGSPTRFLRGQVDELSIYNRALDASEIQGIVAAGSVGKDKVPPVGGSVTGVTPSRIVCINVTRRQTVQIQSGATSWNCEAAGLVVNPGDSILQTVLGRAD